MFLKISQISQESTCVAGLKAKYFSKFVDNKAKGRITKRVFQENKKCSRNVRFLENLTCFVFLLKHPFWDSPFCLITDELWCLIYDSQTNLTDRTSIPRPANLLKKRLWHRCFPVNFAKFLSTPFLQNGSGGCFCTDISKLVTICHYCLLFHVDKILNLHHN